MNNSGGVNRGKNTGSFGAGLTVSRGGTRGPQDSPELCRNRLRQSTTRFPLSDGGMANVPFLRDLKCSLSMWRLAIFESRVCRGIPSFAAAPDGPEIRPSLSISAASIISRSRAAIELTSGAVVRGRRSSRFIHPSSTEKTSPSARMTDLSITFCSSRMLPGQS